MESKTKIVSAPLSINDMDTNLESQTVYIFDYSKSELKNLDFLNYIKHCSLIADIYIDKNVSYEEKYILLSSYISSASFYHITSFNATILNCIYKMKNSNIRIKGGCLNENEMELFINSKKYDLLKWILLYDSLFIYMIVLASLPKNEFNNIKKIKEKYTNISENNTTDISPNVFSLLLDPFFYDYYETGIDKENIEYYPYYFEQPLYDEKPLALLIFNDANYIIKILYDTIHNPEFEKYLRTKTNLILN